MRQLTKLIVWGLGVVIIAIGTYYLLISMGRHPKPPLPGTENPLRASVPPSLNELPQQTPVAVSPVREMSIVPSSSNTTPFKTTQKVQSRSPSFALPIQSNSHISTPQHQKAIEIHVSDRQKKLKQIQSRLLQVVRQKPGTIDIDKLDGLLTELGQFKDKTGMVGGVNIDALRQKLAVTDKIQKLSRQIQQEASTPQGQIDITKLKADTQKLRELQMKILPANSYVAPASGQ